ncbi:Asp-tRNA(Asn)/Glu-tRNA(Gln) amidotransferase subunit GatC [Candidatus Saccharibacteria bacterium]|nr:Asp-tRNA(Asn)/Glu-tRNA(Gln) amidotransferase subunit GatC [Candidatus Saccharibacteria bacterium]
MAQLTDNDVLDLAKLAKLSLSNEEVEHFKKDLDEILNFVEKLNELNTEGLEPTRQVTGLTNVMRQDKVQDYGIDRKAILDNVPQTDGNQIKVRKVL